MSTQAIPTTKVLLRHGAHRPVNRTAERIFFAVMAILAAPSYTSGSRPPTSPPIIHGATAQPNPALTRSCFHSLDASLSRPVRPDLSAPGRLASLGLISFCLPPVMIVEGRGARRPEPQSEHRSSRSVRLLAIPLLGIASFTVVILASSRTRRNPASQAPDPVSHHRPGRSRARPFSMGANGTRSRARCGGRTRHSGSARHRLRSLLTAPHPSIHQVGSASHIRHGSLRRPHRNDAGVAHLRLIPRPHRSAPRLNLFLRVLGVSALRRVPKPAPIRGDKYFQLSYKSNQ